MDNILSKIRDLLIITGMYLFFVSWVYMHYYYRDFGLSTADLKLSYSEYLVYSYNVVKSSAFLIWFIPAASLLITRGVLMGIIRDHKGRRNLWAKLYRILYESTAGKRWLEIKDNNRLAMIGTCMVLLFAILFSIASKVAEKDYQYDRSDLGQFRIINLFFKTDNYMLSPSVSLDTVNMSNIKGYKNDLIILKNDGTLPYDLHLLGETDQYYYVLSQASAKNDSIIKGGFVYLIKKEDVQFAKITLSSVKKTL